MNYRKTTSRLSSLTKTNAPFVLIAFCVIAVLLVIVAAPPYPAHAQQDNGDPSQMDGQSPVCTFADFRTILLRDMDGRR